MDTKKRGAVGILGGMGPLATLAFYRRLILLTPASRDQDHLRIFIDNNPQIPDRTAAILNGGEDPLPFLQESARGLERAGADFIVMPCNSAHYYLEGIREAVKIAVLSMIEETVSVLEERVVGLLATDGVLRSGLYHRACQAVGITLLEPTPEDQKTVITTIYGIEKGRKGPSDYSGRLKEEVDRFQSRGARAVIVGCTELSLIPNENLSIPAYDALDILARATVKQALAGHKIKS